MSAGVLFFETVSCRPLRTSCWIVGTTSPGSSLRVSYLCSGVLVPSTPALGRVAARPGGRPYVPRCGGCALTCDPNPVRTRAGTRASPGTGRETTQRTPLGSKRGPLRARGELPREPLDAVRRGANDAAVTAAWHRDPLPYTRHAEPAGRGAPIRARRGLRDASWVTEVTSAPPPHSGAGGDTGHVADETNSPGMR